MRGAIEEAERIHARNARQRYCGAVRQPRQPRRALQNDGPRALERLRGQARYFVAGVGTAVRSRLRALFKGAGSSRPRGRGGAERLAVLSAARRGRTGCRASARGSCPPFWIPRSSTRSCPSPKRTPFPSAARSRRRTACSRASRRARRYGAGGAAFAARGERGQTHRGHPARYGCALPFGRRIFRTVKGHAARRAARDARLNEEFARLCGEACAAGRVQKDCTLSAKRAGLFGTLCALPFAAAAAVLYVFFAPRVLLATGSLFFEPLLLAAALLALVPLHEGVHALASAAVHRSFYGIRLRVLGTPQCVCLRFANRAQYAVTALAPFVLLGLAPAAGGHRHGLPARARVRRVRLHRGGGGPARRLPCAAHGQRRRAPRPSRAVRVYCIFPEMRRGGKFFCTGS